MANAFDAYFRGMQGSMQAGQNAFAMEQAVQKMQRDKQLRNILAGAYEQPQAAIPAQEAVPQRPYDMPQSQLFPGEAPIQGLQSSAIPAQAAVPAQAGGFNVGGAQQQLLAKGFIPEAMQMEGFKPKKPPGFTLSEGQARFDAQGNIIAKGGEKKPKPGESGSAFDLSSKLRKEFTSQTKDFVKVRDAYRRIEASAKDPSAAGDMALIFNYMKVLDPGSTVREGEFATAQSATGVPERVINTYNQVLSGQRLNPAQRLDFIGRAKGLYSAQLGGLKQLEDQYAGLATQFNVDPKNVIVDYRVKNKEQVQAPPVNTKGWGLMIDAQGNKAYVGPNGEVEEIQ